MHKMSHFHLSGFRRLHDVDLEMRERPLMVMIGANGSGKSSFLDAFSLLSASAAGNLNPKLNMMGGIANILTLNHSQEISMSIDMHVPHHEPLKYDLHITPMRNSYTISRETLTQNRIGYSEPFRHIDSHFDNVRYYEIEQGKLLRPNWDYNPLETSLSQVPKMYQQPEELRRILSSASHFHVLDVGERSPIKLPQQLKPADLPGENGEDIIPFLFSLSQNDPNRFETIIDTLKSAFQGFENLYFPSVAAGMLAMTWKEKHFEKQLFMNQISEGILRFIWLISLLQSPGLPTITMIDEPEVSLHPELLSLLADLMREAAQRTQLIVATHSDRLIRFLDPKEVVVMDIDEDGFATAKWADSLDLDAWLTEYSLGELWRMGRMGGRA